MLRCVLGEGGLRMQSDICGREVNCVNAACKGPVESDRNVLAPAKQ